MASIEPAVSMLLDNADHPPVHFLRHSSFVIFSSCHLDD
jgi:hypothetical protein